MSNNCLISLSLSLIYCFFNKHVQSMENHTCLRGHLRSDHLSPPLPPYCTSTFIPCKFYYTIHTITFVLTFILSILSLLYSELYFNNTSYSLFATVNGSLISVHLSFNGHC